MHDLSVLAEPLVNNSKTVYNVILPTAKTLLRKFNKKDNNKICYCNINSRSMQARKTEHGLDGQHQDVDRTPRGRVNQNDRGQR